MVEPGAETAHPHKEKESPDDRVNLPFSGEEGTDKPHQDGAPAWFVSCFYFWLKAVQVDDIIQECHSAEIKASSEKTAEEALQGASFKDASHAGQGLHHLPPRDPRVDTLQGPVSK